MIATARLRLRPFSLADAPKLLVMSGEAGLRRWIPDQVYRDLPHAEQVVRTLVAFTDEPFDPRVRPYVLGVEHGGVLVGHVGLSPARGSVEIGYAIEERLHGNGLATEAVAAIVQWAALVEVLGIVATDNASSCRVLEKAGFVRVGDEGQRRVYRYQRPVPP